MSSCVQLIMRHGHGANKGCAHVRGWLSIAVKVMRALQFLHIGLKHKHFGKEKSSTLSIGSKKCQLNTANIV